MYYLWNYVGVALCRRASLVSPNWYITYAQLIANPVIQEGYKEPGEEI
jgi:hypothetical protein